jgi:hypothetical protein
MRTAPYFQILWRLVLAISLVTAPLVPTQAAAHQDASVGTELTAAPAMPCHDLPAAPPAHKAPCDDGCCPMPDCDPSACRMAGSLMAMSAPLLPALPPAAYLVSFRAPAIAGVPFGEPLRPPIA